LSPSPERPKYRLSNCALRGATGQKGRCDVRHSIRVEGFAYLARPLEVSDAEFIVEVRTPDRSRHMQSIVRTIEAQRDWIERYFERPGEYYFVIERTGTHRPEALSCLLTPDEEARSIQWGRFIVRPGSRAGVESAIFMHQVAFEILHFDRIWGDALMENVRMLAYCRSVFHDPIEQVMVCIDGRMEKAIRSGITRERAASVERLLTDRARRIADELDGTVVRSVRSEAD
jgi:hypothetical protein